jgi:hypothetical protein
MLQDCVREKHANLRHYANYNTFAKMLFHKCNVLKEHAVSASPPVCKLPRQRRTQ